MTDVQILTARDVPLGGVRAIDVRRTLPHKSRSLVGAWCFADHYGPQPVGAGNDGGMDVPPHPHTGLATVSWLFEGTIEHRDSDGVVAPVLPGEVNLMNAGRGIAHSEVSIAPTTVLHGVQLWVALPDAARDTGRDFAHFVPTPRTIGGATLRVFLGDLADCRSPVHTFTPLLGAQLDLDPGSALTLDVDPAFEHGVLLDQGAIEVGGTAIDIADLAYQGPGRSELNIVNRGDGPARAILLGGPPFGEQLVMWWNFVGRSHEDIVAYRELWQANDARFGDVKGYQGKIARLPAPPLPNGRLQPRG